ncbi:hypothetical protein KKC45_04005 [Patescibacteria group bacterium]|nr:hypothetical protein [Patescibacteria group bacterium]
MAKNIGVDAAKLAGLQIDQNQKLRDGSMTIEQMEWWLSQSFGTRESLMNGNFIETYRWITDLDGAIHFKLTGL